MVVLYEFGDMECKWGHWFVYWISLWMTDM
jgi:hypothetical protein